jgi:hypothetical protein
MARWRTNPKQATERVQGKLIEKLELRRMDSGIAYGHAKEPQVNDPVKPELAPHVMGDRDNQTSVNTGQNKIGGIKTNIVERLRSSGERI